MNINEENSAKAREFLIASNTESLENQMSNLHLVCNSEPVQLTVTPKPMIKEWHRTLTPNLRNHHLLQFLGAIFRAPHPQVMFHKRMRDLVTCARQVESNIYETANSISEYCDLLAQKTYRIQKEIELKKQKRGIKRRFTADTNNTSVNNRTVVSGVSQSIAINLRQTAVQAQVADNSMQAILKTKKKISMACTSGTLSSSADSEFRKLFQRQLKLLLHAQKCQIRERQSTGKLWRCTLPHCKTMKNGLNHMATCDKGKVCTVLRCSSSQQIITHWKKCQNINCPFCSPLRRDNKRDIAATIAINQQQPNPSHLGITVGQSAVSTGQQVVARNISLPQFSGTVHNQSIATGQIGAVTATSANFQQFARNIQRVFGRNDVGEPAQLNKNRPSNLQLPGSLQPGHITATPIQGNKEWHKSFTPDFRNYVVHKLVQGMFPTPNPQAISDKRLSDVTAEAREIEAEMYRVADSRLEYYHLMCTEICEMSKGTKRARA